MRKDLKTGFFVGMVVAAAVMVAVSIYSTTVEQRLKQQPVAGSDQPEGAGQPGQGSPVGAGEPDARSGGAEPVVSLPGGPTGSWDVEGIGVAVGTGGGDGDAAGVDIAELMETALPVEPDEPEPSQYQPVEPQPAVAPAKPAPKRRQMYHVVVEGETLSSIAHLHYGDGEKWPKLYNANRDIIKNTNFLKPGM
ncbi:MAG: LysM peptidoglycan-binding domain-containing protein, partial [Planctomycetes bacterium]|nr:LysM peptidoglycan-binding domain-containing protein [Planctomycetota bacterium]